MTIDEAIKHCLEVAEKNDGEAEVYDLLAKNHNSPYEKLTASRFHADCAECAADHRQLAEWLTELKQWRRVYGVCPSYEMYIPECKEGYNAQIAEYKRLLKAAVEDINDTGACETCEYYPVVNSDMCQKDNCYKWHYANEIEKLLNDEE